MLDFLTSNLKPKAVQRPGSLGIRLTSSSTIELTSPPWLRQLDRRMNSLMNLAPGWDGPESLPVSCESALSVWQFLLPIVLHETPAPQIVPTFSGGLQVEWHLHEISLEVRFEPNEPATFYYEQEGSFDLEGNLSEKIALVASLIRGLPARNEVGQPMR